MPKFKHETLRDFAERLLAAGGFPNPDAQLVAKLLLKAELAGYPGHGISRVSSYVAWARDGTLNLKDKPEIVRERKTTAVIDGHHYIGQAVAQMGMELALRKAAEHGVGVVALRRAGHVGRLADFVTLAAGRGMIGMAAVSVGAGNTAPYGSMERATGTNPIAFAIPGRGGRHIVLDFATSATSMGELQKKLARKERLPEGMMLDGQGNPTTDYRVFLGPPRGVFLPFGGYRGSGINLMTEILGGILSGHGLGKEWWNKGGHANNGVFLQAIAVEELLPLDDFLAKIDDLVSFIKSQKPAPGFREILLPGERARELEARQLKTGVEVDAPTWSQLTKLAVELGVAALPEEV